MPVRRRAAAVLLVAMFAGGLVACEEPADPVPLDGLVGLAGDGNDRAIRAWFEPAGDGTPIATPDGAAWVSATKRDVLAVALADGTLRVSDSVGPGSGIAPDWDEPEAIAVTDPAEGPFYFPTWDPEGGRLAVLAGDPGSSPRLTLMDPATDSAFEIELDRPVAAAPPAWIGPDRVAVSTGDGPDAPVLLVDTTDGGITEGPSGSRLIASSADGTIVALAAGDGQPVTVRPTADWIDGGSEVIARVSPPGDAVAPAAIAVDGPTRRIAIAWLRRDGSTRVAVHGPDDGWRHGTDPGLASTTGAALAWLR